MPRQDSKDGQPNFQNGQEEQALRLLSMQLGGNKLFLGMEQV